jgi:hypothetical protein
MMRPKKKGIGIRTIIYTAVPHKEAHTNPNNPIGTVMVLSAYYLSLTHLSILAVG